MQRKDALLAMLAAAGGRPFQPVHLQKALFLASRKAPGMFDAGQGYDFQPYDYGPFNSGVYADADALRLAGLVSVEQEPGAPYRVYRLTAAGSERGAQLLEGAGAVTEQIRRIANYVTSLSFRALVSAIYQAYPEMKARSVFNA